MRTLLVHVGPVVTYELLHSGVLSAGLVARYAAEGAAPVEVDADALDSLGVRVRGADLLSDDVSAGIRHDPEKLAEEVCEAALVRL